MAISEVDKARAEAAVMDLEDSIKKGHISAQQVAMLEKAQSDTPFGYDPSQSSPEAVNLVTLYNTMTGEPHPTPEYMIRNYISRRFPRETWIPQDFQGRPVYSLEPNSNFHTPALDCWLDKKSDRKPGFEALGIFTVCEKGSGFNNEFEVESHMRSAHKNALNAYETATARREQRELMDLQRAMLEVQKAQLLANTPPTPKTKET